MPEITRPEDVIVIWLEQMAARMQTLLDAGEKADGQAAFQELCGLAKRSFFLADQFLTLGKKATQAAQSMLPQGEPLPPSAP